MNAYTAIVDRLLWPVWEARIKRRSTPALLAALRASETASLESLRDGQVSALRKLLIHAGLACPYYRRVIGESRITAARASFETLRSLPILSRAAAHASAQARCSTSAPLPAIKKTTGGTTGEPLVIRYDLESENWRQAVKLRGFGWAGYRVGAPSLHYWGAPSIAATGRAAWKQRVDRAVRRETWLDCNEQSESARFAAVRAIAAARPEFLFAYAQAAADLARFINRCGHRNWPEIRVIAGAEKIYGDNRAELERAFGEVFETYGCREVMLIATECERHTGLHVSMENLIVEIVDDDGEPVPPGTIGRVVITDLHNYGCPLIRYANGDLAIATPDDERCLCGRAHSRIASVEGRQTETLRDAAGSPVGGMVFNLLFSPLADDVRQFQVHQRADSSIVVRLVPAHPTLSPRVTEHLEKTAARYLAGLPLHLEITDDIPLSRSGKKRVVIVDPPA